MSSDLVKVGEEERLQQKCYYTEADYGMLQNNFKCLLGKVNFTALPRFLAIWRIYFLHLRIGILIYSTILDPLDLIPLQKA